ncbi:MAG: SDR family oxidoreductase [Candidatus Omnitrophota bacterium]|nr:MAG: SDR family oxidoreductase [Candidatus Omnitrophota bacterium]
MNTLLTGATGLLGSYIVKAWRRRGNLIGLYSGNYKIEDKEIPYYICDVRDNKLESIFRKHKIDSVIHTAGESRVDFCERNYEHAYSTNVTGTKNIIELCKRHKSRLVYVSTNAVFDGTKPPYRETDTPNPINTYGRIKLECEKLVREASDNFLIIRPILMYGWNNPKERENIATWLLRKLKNNEQILLVDDIYDNMLYALECADSLLKLAEESKGNVYHIAGKDILNRYQFGLKLAEIFGYDKNLIKPVKNSFFKEIAPRPKNTSYDTAKLEKELKARLMGVEAGLSAMFKEKNCARQEAVI